MRNFIIISILLISVYVFCQATSYIVYTDSYTETIEEEIDLGTNNNEITVTSCSCVCNYENYDSSTNDCRGNAILLYKKYGKRWNASE